MNPENNRNTTDLTKPKNTLGNGFSSALFYLSILFFIIGFNFSDRMAGNWYQQFLPNLGPSTITDITFVDSLVGYAVTNYQAVNDTDFIVKTTNGGDNWIIIRTDSQQFAGFNRVVFLNKDTGYTCGVSNFPTNTSIQKTTNAGQTWNNINPPDISDSYNDISVFNEDTIWIVSSSSSTGGVFHTTNGGLNWTQQLSQGAANPDKIYMFNSRIGYANRNGGSFMYKTTNSGLNWQQVAGTDGFSDIYFADSLTGWKCSVSGGFMKKTTDGGVSWVTQTLPSGGIIQTSGISNFSNINKDTIWSNGGYVLYPNNQARAMLYRTTNQGKNWLFQIPDTSILMDHRYVNFSDKNHGWSYSILPTGIHTTNGGDTTFIVPVVQISAEIPKDYKLFRNYPNPFNPTTNIKYQITKSKYVKIIVYDITGKQVKELVSQEQKTGMYEVAWDASAFSSGVYLYSLIIDGKLIDTRKMILIK